MFQLHHYVNNLNQWEEDVRFTTRLTNLLYALAHRNHLSLLRLKATIYHTRQKRTLTITQLIRFKFLKIYHDFYWKSFWVYFSGEPPFIPCFSVVRVTRSLVLCIMFWRSLFVLLSFFFWLLCYLSFDLRILIAHLISSLFLLFQVIMSFNILAKD